MAIYQENKQTGETLVVRKGQTLAEVVAKLKKKQDNPSPCVKELLKSKGGK